MEKHTNQNAPKVHYIDNGLEHDCGIFSSTVDTTVFPWNVYFDDAHKHKYTLKIPES